MTTTSHIAVLARVSELGQGKRRLARTMGDEATLDVYRHLLRRCASAITASQLSATVFQTPRLGDADIWSQPCFDRELQAAGSLGDRIRASAKRVLAKAEKQAVSGTAGALVIGSDCPTISGELLQRAAAALQHYDAVLGPTFDGGYYLLGVRRWDDALITGIAWSSGREADQTRAAFGKLGWSFTELEPHNDIDEEADWLAYQAAQV